MEARNLFVYLLIIPLLFLACKKNSIDVRKRVTGKYSFLIHSKTFAPAPYNQDTTYQMDGEVFKGTSKNQLIIEFADGTSSDFEIFEDRSFESDGGCKGEFETTGTLRYTCYSYSPGASTTITVSGEKK